MIWVAITWPLLAGAVSVILFNRRVTVFEAIALFIAPSLVIWYLNDWGRGIGTTDQEYWTAPIVKASLGKAWTERVDCTHIEEIETVTKSGRKKKSSKSRHPFDTVNHASTCYAEDAVGQKIKISEEHYELLCRKFGNREKQPRPPDMVEKLDWVAQVTTWGGHDANMEVATTVHTYTNRIPASHSEYRYQEVDPAEWRLYNYPEIEDFYYAPTLLGLDNPEASRQLDLLNAKWGPKNQVRVLILVFIDKPIEAALAQESYWQGGNQNEFVLCIGVDYKKDVKWSHVFSWTEVESLKIEARNLIADQMGKRLELNPIFDWLEKNLQRFERKSFSDFDYLSVTPPLWYVLTAHILVVFVTGLWFYLAVVRPNRK